MALLKQSTARNRAVFMVDSSDHVTGKTGLTLTITASKNGAAFASISPTVTELSNGWYNVALTSSHTDTLGDLALHITGTAADPTDLLDEVVAFDPGVAWLAPTVAGRTLDVSATGEAGIDWANIGSATTTVNLSGTTIKTATDVETDTADIQTRLPAALVSGRMDSSVGAMATDTITSTALAASAVSEIAGGVWDESRAGHTTLGTFGDHVRANVIEISGDSAAADNAESFFDGTGYAGTNNVIPLVTVTTDVTNMVTANVTQISGDATAADNAESFFDGTGYAGTNNVIPTVTSVTNGVTLTASQLFIKKNTALSNFEFLMTDSTNHNPATGLTVTGTVSIDGAAFASLTNSVTEVANGIYKINLDAADVNGTVITLRFVASGADDQLITIITQA